MNQIFALLLALAVPAAAAAPCSATSGERRVPVLELYTSEGCSSCPPVDRWVSGLPARGFGPRQVVILSFHVDYWDNLGWKDALAQRRFSERQRAINARNGSRFVYTPQLLFNGKDYRRGLFRDDIAERIAAVAQGAPTASITLHLTPPSASGLGVEVGVALTGAAPAPGPQVILALYENGLSTQVRAGENRGRHLKHDFVVRDLVGPFVVGREPRTTFRHVFPIALSWRATQLAVAALVHEPARGDVLQALSLPVCAMQSNS